MRMHFWHWCFLAFSGLQKIFFKWLFTLEALLRKTNWTLSFAVTISAKFACCPSGCPQRPNFVRENSRVNLCGQSIIGTDQISIKIIGGVCKENVLINALIYLNAILQNTGSR